MSDETEKPGAKPSLSTGVQIIGGTLATTFIVICDKAFNLQFPAGYEAGLAVSIGVIISYLHSTGRT